jgi:glutamine cyclotransferase
MNNKLAFIIGYIDAALFADTPEEYEGDGLSEESHAALVTEAAAFYDENLEDIEMYSEGVTQAGHDLWYTRNGHGVGYWEVEGAAANRLNEAAYELGGCDLYEGDDGLLYVGY